VLGHDDSGREEARRVTRRRRIQHTRPHLTQWRLAFGRRANGTKLWKAREKGSPATKRSGYVAMGGISDNRSVYSTPPAGKGKSIDIRRREKTTRESKPGFPMRFDPPATGHTLIAFRTVRGTRYARREIRGERKPEGLISEF